MVLLAPWLKQKRVSETQNLWRREAPKKCQRPGDMFPPMTSVRRAEMVATQSVLQVLSAWISMLVLQSAKSAVRVMED